MRADAKKNYEHLLAVARDVALEHGAEASLRDIARKADVGLATLYRHFPTREALFDALLRDSFDTLKNHADVLASAEAPDRALVSWLRDLVACANDYRGIIALMVAAIEDPNSALHASCGMMKASGTQLLVRAQKDGLARTDIDGADLFALVGALAWLGDQPAIARRADHLFDVISGAILKG